jgi:F0F1-type ATP synthase assembly protein I
VGPEVTGPADDRSPMAVGIAMASMIISIGLEMVIPGLIGYWLDGRFGTGPLLLLIGFAIGIAAAGWQLTRLVAKLSAANSKRANSKRDSSKRDSSKPDNEKRP